MSNLTFADFRRANVARCIKWHPEGIDSWSPSDWLTAVTGELGELASLLKMRNRERDGLPGNKFSPTQKQIADELADVLTYLDLLAEVLGVDLGSAAVAKFNEVSERVGFPDRIALAASPPQPEAADAPEAGNRWRRAVDDALVNSGLDCTSNGCDPHARVRELLDWTQRIALDPAVSAEAQALIDRGKAEAGGLPGGNAGGVRLEVGRTYLDRCGYPRIVSREVPPEEVRQKGLLMCRWFEVRFVNRGVLERHGDNGGFVSRNCDDGWRMENGRSNWRAESLYDLIEPFAAPVAPLPPETGQDALEKLREKCALICEDRMPKNPRHDWTEFAKIRFDVLQQVAASIRGTHLPAAAPPAVGDVQALCDEIMGMVDLFAEQRHVFGAPEYNAASHATRAALLQRLKEALNARC